MSERTEADVVAELEVARAALDALRTLNPRDLTPEQVGKRAEYHARFSELHKERAEFAKRRNPLEHELTYALNTVCRCGAPLAYFSAEAPQAWSCADVLLGKFDGRLAKDVFQVEKSAFGGGDPPGAEGKELHDVYPFTFWKIRHDPERTTR